MEPKQYTIQELSELSGYSRRTIRYYIQEGLLEPPAGRGRGGFYYDSHLQILSKIRQLQNQGLQLSSISQILKGAESETLGDLELHSDEEVVAEHDLVAEYDAVTTTPAQEQALHVPKFLRSTYSKSTPKSPSREVWIQYPLIDGVALHVRGDIDVQKRKKIDQVIRLVGSIIT